MSLQRMLSFLLWFWGYDVIISFNASFPVIPSCWVIISWILLASLTGHVLPIRPAFDEVVVPE